MLLVSIERSLLHLDHCTIIGFVSCRVGAATGNRTFIKVFIVLLIISPMDLLYIFSQPKANHKFKIFGGVTLDVRSLLQSHSMTTNRKKCLYQTFLWLYMFAMYNQYIENNKLQII